VCDLGCDHNHDRIEMTKTPIKINEYFIVKGDFLEMIYSPPLLAEVGNLRVELRKELNHSRPHLHVIKKCGKSEYGVSLALDNLDVLAGSENIERFDRREYEAVLNFIIENLELFEKVYKTLRGI